MKLVLLSSLFFLISCQKNNTAKSYLCEGMDQYSVCTSHTEDVEFLDCAGNTLTELSQKLETTTMDGISSSQSSKVTSAMDATLTCFAEALTNVSPPNEIRQCMDNFEQTINTTLNCN